MQQKLTSSIKAMLICLLAFTGIQQLNAQAPTITNFTPVSVVIGSPFTVIGTNLSNPTSLTVGGTNALILSSSSTKIVGLLQSGTTTGAIAVTTASGTATSAYNLVAKSYGTPTTVSSSYRSPTNAFTEMTLGKSIATSANGNVTVFGGKRNASGQLLGCAYVLTTTIPWQNDNNTPVEIAASDAIGDAQQGDAPNSVAVNADGSTIAVGGRWDNSFKGAVWIYTKSGSSYTQQAKLVGTGSVGPYCYLGTSVSLSADGNTAIVGAPYDNYNTSTNTAMGAAWVFVRNGTTWTQQAKLIGTGSTGTAFIGQGNSVSISADGNTAVVGGQGDNNNLGAVWVFTRSGSTWTQQTKLSPTGSIGSPINAGAYTSLSGDGNTVITGGIGDNGFIGASWVFKRSGGTWAQEAKLIGTGASTTRSVTGVSLNYDGNVAAVGGGGSSTVAGLVWLFKRTGSTWAQSGSSFTYSTAGQSSGQNFGGFGNKIAMSSNGKTILTANQNATWFGSNTGLYWYITASDTSYKNGNLSALSFNVGTLSPSFDPNTTTYSLGTIPNSQKTFTAVAIPDTALSSVSISANSTNVNLSGDSLNNFIVSSPLPLKVGSNTITVTGSAINVGQSNRTKIYTVTANRLGSSAAAMFSLTATAGGNNLPLSPSFDSTVFSYTSSVANSVSSINIVPTLSDNEANLKVYLNGVLKNGAFISGNSYFPNPFNVGVNTITFQVTSSDGSVTKTYTYAITRLANVDLSALVVNTATLSPTFAAATTAYTASVSNATTSVTVKPTISDATSTMQVRVNGGTYVNIASAATSSALSLNVGANPIDVKVTGSDGTTVSVYTVTVTRQPSTNADLSAYTISSGSLSPGFGTNTLSYTTANVAEAVSTVNVTATKSDATATLQMNVNGGTYTTITSGVATAVSLTRGTNTINTKVTAQDGTTIKTYTITVIRLSTNANLTALALSNVTLAPTFATATTAYTATVANAVSTTKATATLEDATASIQVRVNSGSYNTVANGSASSALTLNVGSNTIDVKVTALDGTTIKTYTTTITRLSNNANLSALTISSGTLSPSFTQATTSYTASVSNATASITTTPTKADATASIQVRVNGGSYATVASGSASGSLALNVGSNTVDYLVTAQDGTTKTYTVAVTRKSNNANLSALSPSLGNLSPGFAAATIAYTLESTTATSLTVTPTKADANATIQVKVNSGSYSTVASGSASSALALNLGSNTITVLVTAQDVSFTQAYTITVYRISTNANLSALTTSAGTLSPSFAQATTSYTTAAVSTATTSITITPTKADATATIQTRVNGGPYSAATSGSANTITLSQGANAIDIMVTAEDGATIVTYTITIIRTCSSLVTPSVSISTPNTTVCSAALTTFTATGVNTGTSPIFQWTKNGISVGTGTTIGFVGTLVNNDTIACILTANNACQTTAIANSNKIKMKVNISPSIGAIKNNVGVNITSLALCTIGGSSTLYNNFPGGVWSSSDPSIATAVNGVSASGGVSSSGLATAVSNGTATVFYTITSGNGCSAVAFTTMVVDEIPALSPTVVSSPVCVHDSIALTNSSPIPTGGTGVWTSLFGRATVNAATGVVTGTSTGPAVIKYTITSVNGCSNSTTANITVNSLPGVPSINYAAGTVNPQTGVGGGFCANRTFNVVGNPTGGVWSSTGSISVNATTGAAVTSSTLGAGSLTYTYTDANGCSNSRTNAGNVVACLPRGVNGGMASGEQLVASWDFTIYPNPAKTFISLNVKTLIGSGSIVVTDLYGKQVKVQSLSMGTNTIDVSKLSKGMYFVSTITNEGKTTKKLVVE